MDKKDMIEACLKQAEIALTSFIHRGSFEWKVTLMCWAGLLAGAKFMHDAQVHVPTAPLLASGALFMTLYTFIWLRGVWNANDNDKTWSIFYRREASTLLSTDAQAVGPAPKKSTPPLNKFLSDYSALFQILMTGLIVAAAVAVIASSPPGSSHTPEKKPTPSERPLARP
jgi:hypothetical protein